jgi:hypothetical protein
MCCPSWRWSRRRPATLPQCISSNVHLHFKRLLFDRCTSGSMRGFGCESRFVWWVTVRSQNTVLTCGMCRSEWRVWLETYRGALVIVLRSLDWYRWMTALLTNAHVYIRVRTHTHTHTHTHTFICVMQGLQLKVSECALLLNCMFKCCLCHWIMKFPQSIYKHSLTT